MAHASSTPTLRKEYLDMIPEYSGDPTMLSRFISICDKVVNKFYVSENTEDFQNEYLFSSILSKIKNQALEIVVSSNTYLWSDVRQTLLTTYLDKRDCFTLNLEMSELKQESHETPFKFYEKIQKILNLQIAFFTNKEASARDILCTYVQKLALRVLLRGLQEPLGSLMRTKNPSSLEDALNMLTNDFQFKKTNKSIPNNKPVIQKVIQVQRPINKIYQQKPTSYQEFQNKSGQNKFIDYKQKQNFQPKQYQPKQYQPTPMSISTRQSPIKNTKMYQITAEDDLDENLCDYEEVIYETNTEINENCDLDQIQQQFENVNVNNETCEEENNYFLGHANVEENLT